MTERSMTSERAIATWCRFFAEYQFHVAWSFLSASPEEWSENLKAIVNKLGGK
jgi:hypothetical protein